MYPTWLEVDKAAIAHNTRYVLRVSGVPLMAVVKANAYGFGSLEVARTVIEAGASWLAVARCGEALALRAAGIRAPILVLGMATADEVDAALAQQITLTLYGTEIAEIYSRRAAEDGRTLDVHLKIDTGMGRLGVLADEAAGLAVYAQNLGGLAITGAYSHLSLVEDEENDPLTPQQQRRFDRGLAGLAAAGVTPAWVHCSNSASLISHAKSRYNLVRGGSILLGVNPFYYRPFPAELRRALSWKTQLASCRRLPEGWGVGYGEAYKAAGGEWIGVLPLGYGDGFRRIPGNDVLIRGKRVPVVGNVCTDMCMVRLPEALPLGEEVVVIGQQGQEAIWIEELSKRWRISYADVTSTISGRVPRISV
jgi:alanine racemase